MMAERSMASSAVRATGATKKADEDVILKYGKPSVSLVVRVVVCGVSVVVVLVYYVYQDIKGNFWCVSSISPEIVFVFM